MTRSARGPRLVLTVAMCAMLSGCNPGGELPMPSVEYIALDGEPRITQLLLAPGEQGRAPYLYALDAAQRSIHVVGTSSHTALTRVVLDDVPLTMAFDSGSATLYVALKNRNEIRAIDVDTHSLKSVVLTLPAPATSLSVGVGRRLYAGIPPTNTSGTPAPASVQVFDLSVAQPLAEALPGTDHGYIVGVSHDKETLITAAFGQIEPDVTRWNIKYADTPYPLETKALFGSGLDPAVSPGTVVFARDDRTVFVLTRGSASYDGRLPVYTFSNAILAAQTSLDVQYTPVAVVLNHANTRAVVVHDATASNATVRDPPRHARNDLHVFDAVTRDEIDNHYFPELPEYIADDGLVIDDDNTLYLIIGRAAQTRLGMIRTEP